MSRSFQIILTVAMLSFLGFAVKSYAGVAPTRSLAPLTQTDRSSLATDLASEASDGDGEIPDAMEAPEQTSLRAASDRSESKNADSSNLAEPESGDRTHQQAEVSDGDGETPDALEHR